MGRINVIKCDEETGTSRVIGWFDYDKVTKWAEGTRWDGNNNVSLMDVGKYGHQALIKTAQGKWVIHFWSQWMNTPDDFWYITPDEARAWLIRAEHSAEAIADAGLGDLPEETGPNLGGRPAIGGHVSVALGDDLLGQLDAEASRTGVTRATLIRDRLAASFR